jgi:preprotein translocase subunit YajC
MTSLLTIILMAPQQSQSGSNPWAFPIMMLAMIAIFYFFMIRPQVKRQKEMAKFRSALGKGDKVITTGGIYGRISEINDQTVMLEVDTNVRIKVDKSALIKDPADLQNQK